MTKRNLSPRLAERMPNHQCRGDTELPEELQIQAAVAAGDAYSVRKMLEQGYSPKTRDANGWTLLHFSATKGNEQCVRVFLDYGANPTVKDLIGGFTALHYAAMHGRARIARLMLDSVFCGDIINAKSNDGWTPLHVAAHYGRDAFVRLLLELKAEVDPLSDKGTTPLQLAMIRERSSCVRILLDHNANIDIQKGFVLRYAVIKGNHSYCRMFLQRGADTNLGRLEDGQTPLHLSAIRDDVLCAQMLYAYGANTNIRNYEGQTPAAVSVSMPQHSRACLDFLQDVSRRPRSLQDLCRIKIRQCIGLQSLNMRVEKLPIATVMKDYLRHKVNRIRARTQPLVSPTPGRKRRRRRR
ncbi:ankyrin repeat and SOCS box protein 7 [Nerophis lumbriciformis]|uniref:ankyrin repeat and SOCS box protein 7 n=1 Tax=Nerophis lumbriciformis TaxID=546530 RepID=UPI002ADFF8DA|nr:ankyrin repeat and SOCS box protein 7-like [Nerophis lumbriciformis]